MAYREIINAATDFYTNRNQKKKDEEQHGGSAAQWALNRTGGGRSNATAASSNGGTSQAASYREPEVVEEYADGRADSPRYGDTAQQQPKLPRLPGSLGRQTRASQAAVSPEKFAREQNNRMQAAADAYGTTSKRLQVENALRKGDYAEASRLLDEMTGEGTPRAQRQQTADYINSLYDDPSRWNGNKTANRREAWRNTDAYMEELHGIDLNQFSAQTRAGAERLLDAYDRDPRQLADLLESEEGAAILEAIERERGGKHEDDAQAAAWENLRNSRERYLTQNANYDFFQRGQEQIDRAAQSETGRAQMDSYLRAQGATLALNDLYNYLDVGGNAEAGGGHGLNTYSAQYLLDELAGYGVDLRGMDESNYRQAVEQALKEQGQRARIMGAALRQAGYDPEAVERVLEYTRQNQQNQARRESTQQAVDNAGLLDRAALHLASTAENVWLSPLENIATWAQLGAGRGNVNQPGSYVPVASMPTDASLVRGAIADTMTPTGAFFYNALSSAADSFLNVSSFGGAGSLASMGASAATQEANDILARGGSNRQAVTGGLAAGAIEVLTEIVSVENLINIRNNPGSIRDMLKSVGVQMFTEGSEEINSEVLGLIVDGLNMGNLSETSQAVQQYTAQGMSYEEAKRRVLLDNVKQVAMSGLSGALSGGVSAGATAVGTSIGNSIAQRAAQRQAVADFGSEMEQLYRQEAARRQAAQSDVDAGGGANVPSGMIAPYGTDGVTDGPGNPAPTADVRADSPRYGETARAADVADETARERMEQDKDAADDFDSLAETVPPEPEAQPSSDELSAGDRVPQVSLREFADDVGRIYPAAAGQRQTARQIVAQLADEIVKTGIVSQEAVDNAAQALEQTASWEGETDPVYTNLRQEYKGQRIYVNEQLRRELGDDWKQLRQAAQKAGITLMSRETYTAKRADGSTVQREVRGADELFTELAEAYPSLFDSENYNDLASFLWDFVDAMETGKGSQQGYDAYIQSYGAEGRAVHEGLRSQLMEAAQSFLKNAGREQQYAEQYGGRRQNRQPGARAETAEEAGQREAAMEARLPEVTVYHAADTGGQGGANGPENPATTGDTQEQAERQVLANTFRNATVGDGVYQQIEEELDDAAKSYDKIHELQSLNEAAERVENDTRGEIEKLSNREREWTGADMDTAMLLIQQAQRDGAYQIAQELAVEAARRGTVAGQMIQALAKWSRTPTGAAVGAISDLTNSGTVDDGKVNAISKRLMKNAKDVEDAMSEIRRAQEAQEDGAPYSGEQMELDLRQPKEKLLNAIYDNARLRGTVGAFSRDVNKAIRSALSSLDAADLELIATAQIRAAAQDVLHKPTAAQRVATAQVLSQLSSLVTINRNLAGNFGFDIFDTVAGNIGVAMDMLLGTKTGMRTLTTDTGYFNEAKRSGARDGFLKAFCEIALDVDTGGLENRYGQSSQRTYKMSGNAFDRFMSRWEKYSGYTLTATDEFFKGGTRESYRARMQKFVEQGKLTQEQVDRLAEIEAKERTFQQDDGMLAEMSVKLKQAMNKVGFSGSSYVTDKNGKRVYIDRSQANNADYIKELSAQTGISEKVIKDAMGGERFGLGNILNNYPRIPANLASLAIQSNPVGGAINTIYTVAKVLQAGENVSPEMQHKAAQAFGRWVTGSALTLAFRALAKAGVLLVSGAGGSDEDKKRAAQRTAQGLSGTQLNLSGLERMLSGGDGKLQDGDTLLSIGFMEPLSANMTIGAMMAASEDEKTKLLSAEGMKNVVQSSYSGTLQSVLDIPVVENVKNFVNNMTQTEGDYDGEKLGNALVELAADSMSGFIPAPIRGLAKAMDANYRETGATDSRLQQTLNTLQNGIPGLREALPERRDALGQEKRYNAGDVNRWLNSLVLPGTVSGYRETDVEGELERMYQATGESYYPSTKAINTITVERDNGEKETVKLTREQKVAFIAERGRVYNEAVAQLLNDPAYRNASEKKKGEMLEAAYDVAGERANVAAGVGYKSEDKLVGLMDKGLSVADAYAAKSYHDALNDYGKDEGGSRAVLPAGAENLTGPAQWAVAGLGGGQGAQTAEPYTKNEKAARFKNWVQGQSWTEAQKQAVLDAYGTYTSMTFSDTEKFDKLERFGLSGDDSTRIMEAIGDLEPIGDASKVTDAQQWELIVNDEKLSDEQKIAAMWGYMDESQQARFELALQGGISPAQYLEVYEAKKTHGNANGNWTNATLKNYLAAGNYTENEKHWLYDAFKPKKDSPNPYASSGAVEHWTPPAEDEEPTAAEDDGADELTGAARWALAMGGG